MKFKCAVCNRVFDDDTEECTYFTDPDGRQQYLCKDCSLQYPYCRDCGIPEPLTQLTEIEGDYYCPRCLQEHVVECAGCGVLVPVGSSDLFCVEERENPQYLCGDCFSERYTYCAECGEVIPIAEAHWHRSAPYCSDCYREYRVIERYHYVPDDLHYLSKANQYYPQIPYMGIELEVDGGDDRHETAGKILSQYDYRLWITGDGSLDCGFEIISHPASLYFHLSQFGWQGVFDAAKAGGFKSHDAGTCGLHVHMNYAALGRNNYERDLTVAKILLFYENNWPNIVKFSRRTSSQLERFCRRYGYSCDDVVIEDDAMDILEHAKRQSRYHAVNLQCLEENGTVEFRIFRGTLVWQTFAATLQFCYILAMFARKSSLTDVLNADFSTLLEFARLNKIPYGEFEGYLRVRKIIEGGDSNV